MYVSEQYKKDINKHYKPIADANEEKQIIVLAKAKNQKAIDKLVDSQLLTVVTVARAFIKKDTDLEDLINVGIQGCIEAIDRFEFDRGTRFITCAVQWVRAYISKYVHEDSLVHLPLNKLNEMKEQKKLIKERKLSENDLAVIRHDVFSIHTEINEDGSTLEDTLGFEDSHVGERNANDISKEILKVVTDPLAKRILELEFGLNGNERMTEEDIATLYKVSKQRINQVKLEALNKIRLRFPKIPFTMGGE
jgi:RNA polymerase sigma factor (sigma-70 family)